jgi:hypothetical protein
MEGVELVLALMVERRTVWADRNREPAKRLLRSEMERSAAGISEPIRP